MKKAYSKPTAELIDFTLSSSIAGACLDEAYKSGLFADLLQGCLLIDGDEFCYHNPTDSTRLFNS